jgi:hypothetical protein
MQCIISLEEYIHYKYFSYKLHVQLNSNINVTSEPNTTRTLEGGKYYIDGFH